MNIVLNFIKGIAIGAGAILPGISSGVICVIFGVYEKLLNAVLNFFKNIKENFKLLFPTALGTLVGIIIFGIFIGYTVTLLYARKLIIDNLENQNLISDGDYEDLTEERISIGEIQKVLFNIISAIVAIGQLAPNIQVIKAACSASSDYFTLYERKPKIYESEKNLTPNRDTIKGSIEFKNIKFIYPSDKAQRPILNGLNLEIEEVKKLLLWGNLDAGKVQQLIY